MSLRIAIAGLGTVGCGTLKLLQGNKNIDVVALSSRARNKSRGIDINPYRWVEDALQLAQMPDVDVVVELIGGGEGIARALAEAALKNKKHVVTANKELLAKHGLHLANLAETNHVTLAFEATVAGSIPIIKLLHEGAGFPIKRIAGILNGTCNYILTAMTEAKRGFEEVLQEAQALGYAEANPAMDVDGHDTAHKLAILTALAFGCRPNLSAMAIEGIRNVTARDIETARAQSCVIKLLGITEKTERGICQRVHPCQIKTTAPLGSVHGVMNAVWIEREGGQTQMLQGLGAGAEPTATSVVADLMDIAQAKRYLPWNIPAHELKPGMFIGEDPLQNAAQGAIRIFS